MTIEEMRECKRVLGCSNEILAEKSGVPLSTVRKVMSGETRNPRRRTMEALCRVLSKGMRKPDELMYLHWKENQEGFYQQTDQAEL